MKEKKPKIRLLFKYKNKEYKIVDDFWTYYDEDGLIEMFWWEAGNGSCDCNRSIFIKEKYKDFVELECGDEIELVDWKLIK